jgi:RHS repeat-associated protein
MQNTKNTWMRHIAAALFCLAGTLNPAQATEIFYLHADHLNTPRLITDTQNQPVWQNTPLSEPFGTSAPDEDPGSTGTPFTFNLRFPGQYYDQETGTHYNYYRDHYFPGLGRYGQSDPIGLEGGINTYAYVGGSPLLWWDWFGLSPEDVKKIIDGFNQGVNGMNADGLRRNGSGRINGIRNNLSRLCSMSGLGCEEYEGCKKQSEILQKSLNELPLEDKWSFLMASYIPFPLHFFLIAISSNPNDPVIYLDAWENSYGISNSLNETIDKNGGGKNPFNDR